MSHSDIPTIFPETDDDGRRRSSIRPNLLQSFLHSEGGSVWALKNINPKQWLTSSINPHGGFYLSWMGMVSFALLYNAFSIPLRVSFTDVQGTLYDPPGHLKGPPTIYSPWRLGVWLSLDVLFDIVYVVDIVLIQWKVNLSIENADSAASVINIVKPAVVKYAHHWHFLLDVVALLPLELFYSVPFLRFNSLLRLPRLLKVRHLRFFLNHFENSTKHPHLFRIARSYVYLIYLIHIFACIHFAISKREGFGSTPWVYDGMGSSYIRCFHAAFLIVSTIRSRDSILPTNNVEYLVELCGSLIGVFFISVIISTISTAVVAANYQNLVMHKKRDMLKHYLQHRKIPSKELRFVGVTVRLTNTSVASCRRCCIIR